jgi:hypothetical protein
LNLKSLPEPSIPQTGLRSFIVPSRAKLPEWSGTGLILPDKALKKSISLQKFPPEYPDFPASGCDFFGEKHKV